MHIKTPGKRGISGPACSMYGPRVMLIRVKYNRQSFHFRTAVKEPA